MVNFTYCNPTRIEFGDGKESEIGAYLQRDGIKKVLLVFGSDRIKSNELFSIVTNSLKAHNIAFVEFGGILSNPLLSRVYEGIGEARKESVDALLAVGGGSVLDSAKAIAAGALSECDVWEFFLRKKAIKKALPIYDIMTLAATGSEMNGTAVITNEKTKQKYSISSPFLYPKISIINPKLQSSVSKEYLTYSAADIITHCIEGYFTASVQPMIVNRQIEAVIKTVIETTEKLIENPDDYEARGEFAWAATCALNGSLLVGTYGVSFPNHMLEHSLSAIANVPHGAGLSVVMPSWMRWYCDKNEKQFKRFSKEIFGQNGAMEGINALEAWFDKIGTPTKLSQLHITQNQLEEVIENATKSAIYFGAGEMYSKDIVSLIFHNANS